jgi:oligopeptide/dipeptide ABC transporter ATP-binding protein
MACVTSSTRTSGTEAVGRARRHARPGTAPTLEIEALSLQYVGRRGVGRITEQASLEVWPREIVGLIGESGSGKTMTALAVLGLTPRGVHVASGDIRLSGQSILRSHEAERRSLRGDRIALIPQDALRALNPVLRIEKQVGEPYVLHRQTPWQAAKTKAVELLRGVHLRSPEQRAREYPHQFSGGMQQRAMIAMGLALGPELLIADEPTTALDVTVQAQVLDLLREIRDTHDTAILFITHDLGVVAELCDWVYVIYAGVIVEQGSVEDLFAQPGHPYSQALLRSTPTVRTEQAELVSIGGQIPSPFDLPPGCRFAERCPHRFERCAAEPPYLPVGPEHTARCWLLDTRRA